MTRTAVLLLAFGGPETLDQVGPFMAKLTGRSLPPQAIERVAERYRQIGGGSPLPRISREQAEALQRRLLGNGAPTVHVGFKYAEPSISTAVRELAQTGHDRIIGISLATHYTRIGVGAYFAELAEAGKEYGVTTVAGDLYYAEPHFLDGLAAKLRQASNTLSRPRQATIIFSAHSLPAEEIERGDPYVEHLRATVDGLLQRVPGHQWRLAYQSKGTAPGPWLEPAVETVLTELQEEGSAGVALAPIGFIADHMETLHDIDVVIAGRAKELGLEFVRASTLNTDELLIEALAAVAVPHL